MSESKNESKIEVVVSSREGTRAIRNIIPKSFSTQQFANNVQEFVQKMSEVLAAVPDTMNDNFELSEFAVSAEIGSKGEIRLLGSGVEVSTNGGIMFKFTKKTR